MTDIRKSNLLAFFVKHKTAANIIMILMCVVGLLSVFKLNRQFFPNFDIENISVSIEWPGATAEEIDRSIISILEPELRPISGVKKVFSKSVEGVGYSVVEFNFGKDMQQSMSDIETAVSRLDFPQNSKKPKITLAEFYDTVTRIVISGKVDLSNLRKTSKQLKEKLLNSGVDKVELIGLPDEEILIQISEGEISKLNMSLNQISNLIKSQSTDIPGGLFADGSLRVRTEGEKRLVKTFENLEIKNFSDGGRIILKDIAKIQEQYDDSSVLKFVDGNPAVEIFVRRSKTNDALETSKNVKQVIENFKRNISPNLKIETYNSAAELIEDRISLLVKNGLTGLILVLGVLFLFLAWKTAIWVALGIPIAFLATFGVMYLSGQSINMISLFGLIMALGIVVDDAIVVGEHSAHLRTVRGFNNIDAPILAATRMSMPVICAMLTTVGAFLPLFMIKGVIGQIIIAIPFVICAVLVASLIECFLVLPAHLSHYDTKQYNPGKFRIWFDTKFDNFKEGLFKSFIKICYKFRYVTLIFAFGLFLIAIGMMKGNRVLFSFFPTPESDLIIANFKMLPGSNRDQTIQMIKNLENGLKETKKDFSVYPNLVKFSMSTFADLGSFRPDDGGVRKKGNHLTGSMVVELVTADKRTIRTNEFIKVWKKNVNETAGLEKINIRAPRGGPPGRDLDVRLRGNNLDDLKNGADELLNLSRSIPGISSLDDNFEIGVQERVLSINNKGQALGFSVSDLGSQVRAAINGQEITRFPREDEEVSVKLKLLEKELENDMIYNLRVISPENKSVILGQVASIYNKLPYSSISRQDGSREVTIVGDLNPEIMNTSQARAFLQNNGLKEIAEKFNLTFRFAGRDLEQKETFADMFVGGLIGLMIIYIVLAWVFKSWLRPLSIMIMIPLSFIGAVFGHYFLNLTMSILSMFALLALAGIVVNNSIILVSTIERRLQELTSNKVQFRKNFENAVISGVTNRLRPVLLTSLTTMGGLTTLMFEKSLQAQFLIPMAATIVFGLGVTAVLVLIVVPSMMGIGQDIAHLFKKDNNR